MLRGKILPLAAGLLLLVMSSGSSAVQDSVFDAVTDARARGATAALEKTYQGYANERAQNIATYTREVMHNLIQNNRHLTVIRDVDQCQFTPDIENRARLVAIPAFEYAWGDMLISGTCVRLDERLGIEYFEKAAEQGYAPAIMRMARFYEEGKYLPQDLTKAFLYMKTAAALGSSMARLYFADMLVRGFAHPAYYETAYSWLYHSNFSGDEALKERKLEVQHQLEALMPMNIVARARASSGI